MVVVCIKKIELFHLQIINESIDSGILDFPIAGRCSFLLVGRMAWFRVDDNFYDHPKVVRIESEYPEQYEGCLALWLRGGLYCARNYTDGFIPKSVLKRLTTRVKLVYKYARTLVEVGLWEELKDGFRIHNFLEYNTSSEQYHYKKQKNKERMRKARATSVRAHNSDSVPNPEPEPEPQKEIDKEKEEEFIQPPYWREADTLTPVQCSIAYTELTCRTYDYQTHKKAFDSIAHNVNKNFNSPKLLERCLAKWLESRNSNKWKPAWFASDLSDLIADVEEGKR